MPTLISTIFQNRSILKTLVSRSFRGTYRSSKLGVTWQFLTPTITVLLFYVVFTSLKVNTGPDYWLYLCSGVFPFNFMNMAIVSGGSCITSNSGMIKKIYIPRELFVIAQVISGFITFAISYTIVILLSFITGRIITIIDLLCIALLMTTCIFFNIGIVFLLSSIVVYIRDLGALINAFSRLLFWVTPVFYKVSSLTGIFAELVWMNPLTYYMVEFQNLIYFENGLNFDHYIVCLLLAIILFIAGHFVFKKLQKGFVERL